jgi:cation:H+ antiporter
MSLPVAILLVLAGLTILAFGGEVLVRGAVALSKKLRVSTAVIGLTIVALATSLPELAVSLLAALRGSPDVATGNVVGSNIFNIAAILGICAVAFPPLKFIAQMIRFDVTIMILASGAALLVMRDHVVGRAEGITFLVLLTVFLIYRVRATQRVDVPADAIEHEVEQHKAGVKGVTGSVVLIFLGAVMLTGGAEVLVRGAVRIAELAGVSERVIALTLVSAGTGLPELATAIMAGIRRHAGVAVGNVIGSNIFNVLGILGTVAIVQPVPVAVEIVSRDMWWMLGFCLIAVLPLLKTGRVISRFEGTLAVAAYVVYISTLL